MPSWSKMVLSVIKLTILQFLGDSKSQSASKSHYWFKSYGDFAEWVDFAYWWSCIGKGLRLQPAQQACFTICKANVELKIISETQVNNYNIENNVFS